MWWLAIPVGFIGLKLIYEAASENERLARQRWENKRQEVASSVAQHQRSISRHLRQTQSCYDFHHYVDLHFASMQAADAAYQLLNDARSCLRAMDDMLAEAKEQKDALEMKLQAAKQARNRALFDSLLEELKIVTALRKSIFDDRDKVRAQREALLQEVQTLNEQTRQLKVCIRDRCGPKGADWFYRLEARKSHKRLADMR
jgi:hypothetical protein